VTGLVIAAIGLAVPVVAMNPTTVTLGVTIAAAGTGALFVVASATALGQVDPHEAGIASGIVSTFHEFGASLGAAAVSSVAAASLISDTLTGFADGFSLAATTAVVAAGIAALLTAPAKMKHSKTVTS
jgi:MFS family permease